jgi:apurinic endonuclease APN1
VINLASENPYFYQASIKSLIDDMKKAKKLGALGVNFHLGSTLGRNFSIVLPKIILAIKDILAAVPGPNLILENSAGAGNVIGDRFSELGKVIKAIDSDRLKVTLDTAHAFASGYDFKSRSGIDAALLEFDQEIGLNRLVCLHLNDSAVPINSKKDRHADIGKGYIGIDGFKNIVNHPKLKNLPGIIETPSNKGRGDIDNLIILRNLID